jgi:hypothetical protein
MLLALIAVNESVGPILFRRALTQSGEMRVASNDGEVPTGRAPARTPI